VVVGAGHPVVRAYFPGADKLHGWGGLGIWGLVWMQVWADLKASSDEVGKGLGEMLARGEAFWGMMIVTVLVGWIGWRRWRSR